MLSNVLTINISMFQHRNICDRQDITQHAGFIIEGLYDNNFFGSKTQRIFMYTFNDKTAHCVGSTYGKHLRCGLPGLPIG